MNATLYKKYEGQEKRGKHRKRSADLLAWLDATAGDNEESLQRMRRALRSARSEALTGRQSEMLRMHYEEEMGVSDIARALGVNRSTVSRTLARARYRLYERLRYTA